ncbi:MAG: Flp family type IVb pilin [Rickettsiales bacterium]|nr:Flp family type IVb pilin [Rickettsiales bacterium]
MKKFTAFLNDESGVTAIEYGLIAALIAVVIISFVRGTGQQVATTFQQVDNAIASGNN